MTASEIKIVKELLKAAKGALEVMLAYNRIKSDSAWANARIDKLCAATAMIEEIVKGDN